MTYTYQCLHLPTNTKHVRTIVVQCKCELLELINNWNAANVGRWFYWY